MSVILSFYDLKTSIVLPETFSKLIQRARLEYSFQKNQINEGLLIYTYQLNSSLHGISSETDYTEFKNQFYQNCVKEIAIQEKEGTVNMCKSDAIQPTTYVDYMEKVISRELELAAERIQNYLLDEHVVSSHFHDHHQKCSNCKKNAIGFLYKCTICDETILCEGCMNQIIEHKHPFFKIR